MSDRPHRRTSVLVPAVIAVVAALVAVVVGTSSAREEPEASPPVSGLRPQSPEPVPSDDPLLAVARRDPGDPLAKGDVDAPVLIVEYSDFQCPFCGRFARETAPVLEREYVRQGLVRIEWRDFPYLGPESTLAARAGRAAAAQDRFWRFHDAMHADQPAPNSGRITEGYLIGVARAAGLDVEAFERDLAAEAGASAVQADFAEGQSIGVTGTPAFLVNGRPVMGAQPVEVFRQLIDQGLAETRAEQ